MQAKSILVVDKDIITRKFLKQTLEKKGHSIALAELGKEGLVFAWRDKPDIIIVDPLLPDLDGELFIQKIRHDARTASIPVIALSANLSGAFGKMCLAQGYTLYLPKLGEAIPDLLSQIENIEKTVSAPVLKKHKGGKLIIFMSGKGGTGVTSITANIATTINSVQKDAKVVAVDMVFPLGSLASLVGYKESINISTLADRPIDEITPEFMIARLPRIPKWKFSLLAGIPTPEAAILLQTKKIPTMLDSLREEFDYLLVDLGRSLSSINLPIIQQANLIVLILGTDKESARLGKIIVDYLSSINIDKKKLFPLLNRAIGLDGLTKPQSEALLGMEVRMTIPYMGGNFVIAYNQNEPVTRKFPNDTGTFMLIDTTKSILETVHKFKN